MAQSTGHVSAYSLKDGQERWRFVAELAPDPATGKRRQATKRGFTSERAAKVALRKLLSEVDEGRHVRPERRTLAGYLTDWLDGVQGSLKATSFADYRQSVEVYVAPRLGGVMLQALTAEHLDGLYRDLSSAGKRAGACRIAGRTCGANDCSRERHGGLAPKSVRNVHVMLHRALSDAVDRGYLYRNPAALAHPPKAKQTGAKTRERAWTRDDLLAFLEAPATKNHRLYALWFTAATTGLRRAELLGLRWADIDLDAGVLRISRTVTATRSEMVVQDSAKTRAGERTVPLDPRTVTVLRDHRRRQAEERLAVRPAWQGGDGSVFTRPDGSLVRPRRASRVFTDLVRAAGLPEIGLHGLRHTHATTALAAGVPVHVVSQRLGHSSVSITLDVYSHVLEGADRDAANLAAAAIFGE